MRVLSRLFRRLFLEQLIANHDQLKFYGALEHLVDRNALDNYLFLVRNVDWIVYAKRPFSGPEAVLSYLSQYTHRIAISNRRLISYDNESVTFKWKDYRAEGKNRYKTMRLSADEFIRRFLIHILPQGFHRIRHFGLFANSRRKQNLTRLLVYEEPCSEKQTVEQPTFVCRTCSTPLVIVHIIERPHHARAPPT